MPEHTLGSHIFHALVRGAAALCIKTPLFFYLVPVVAGSGCIRRLAASEEEPQAFWYMRTRKNPDADVCE